MLARGVQEFSCYHAGDFNFPWYAKRYQSKPPCSFETLHNFSVMSCASKVFGTNKHIADKLQRDEIDRV